MQILLFFSRWVDRINGVFGRAMEWLVFVMVALGVINVVARYLGAQLGMQLSSNAMLEAQTYAYSLVFLLAAAYVLRRDRHIRVDVIYASRSPKTRAWIDLIGACVFLIPFCILALYLSYGYIERSWRLLEGSPNPGGLPRYPIKTIILVCFTLLIFQGLSEAIKRVAWLRGVPGVPGPGDEPPAQRKVDDVGGGA